jgi:hypothetical protein
MANWYFTGRPKGQHIGHGTRPGRRNRLPSHDGNTDVADRQQGAANLVA